MLNGRSMRRLEFFFKEARFNPPSIPAKADEETKMKVVHREEEVIKIIGAIFCQVRRIQAWVHSIKSITWGNQKWVGAIPAFVANEIKIISFALEK